MRLIRSLIALLCLARRRGLRRAQRRSRDARPGLCHAALHAGRLRPLRAAARRGRSAASSLMASAVLPLRQRLRVTARSRAGRRSPRRRRRMMAILDQWFWFFLLLPAGCAQRLGDRPSRRRAPQRQPGQRAVDDLFPRPELPAQRAAGQGDRAVPAHRRTRQGHVRDAGRARPPVPPPRRSRPRDPPAPGSGRSGRDLNEAQKVQALLALGEDYMRSGLLDRAETRVHRSRRDGPARAAGAEASDRHLPGRARLGQGDRKCHALRSGDRRVDGQADRAVRMRARRTRCAQRATSTPRARRSRAPTRPIRPPCAPACSKAASNVDAGNDGAAIRAFERARARSPITCRKSCRSCCRCYERVGDSPGARGFLQRNERALPRHLAGAGADATGRDARKASAPRAPTLPSS